MPLHVASRADDADKHQNDVNQLLFVKEKLYSGADDGKVKVWAPDLTFLQEVQAHTGSIFSLTASDDTLYTSSNDGTVKSWDLNTLQAKAFSVDDEDVEFWKVKYDNGVLYTGDDQGSIGIYKNETQYGFINVATPVKDLVVKDNLLLTSKDNDVTVTDLHLKAEKPTFGIKANLEGRGPLVLIDDKTIFVSRDGKDLILNVIGDQQHLKELAKVTGAHELIINAAAAADWDGATLLFTGGWDKVVKQWKITSDSLNPDGSSSIDFVINALTTGEKGTIYVGGGDGHVARLDL